MKKRLFLFDVMPLLYRAHFATMGKRFGTTTGIDTRTTLVFYNYVLQVLTEEKPEAVAAALDSRPKQRVEVASTYKANRQKMPGEIYSAFPYAMRLLDALRIPVLKEEGYEADDVIAAVAKQGAAQDYEVYIVSPDKDFAQLVTENIFLFRPAYKGAAMETLDPAGVKDKYGVEPAKIADFLALRGDSVDNIIGVKGIGDKTAAQLLEQFESIEHLIEKVDFIKQEKVRDAVTAYAQQLLENKHLALLTGNLDVAVDWNEIAVQNPDEDRLLPLLEELQFVKIKERLAKLNFINPQTVEEGVAVAKPSVTARVTVDELNKIAGNKVAVGFTEARSDRLLVFEPAGNRLYEVVAETKEDWSRLVNFLDQGSIQKLGWQLKPLLKTITRLGLELKSEWIDLSLAAYLLSPDTKIEWSYVKDKYGLAAAVANPGYEELAHVALLPEAGEKILAKLEDMELTRLFFDIELPLQQAIVVMELHGINIDTDALKEIDKVLSQQLDQLAEKLYEQAGMRFNLNSPSKTAEVLRQMVEPAALKKTKTGQISTAEPFLIDLAPKYPFIADLLTYRKLNKIITTYVYALPRYIDRVTQKIHPTFQQVVAGTGRLSCTEPNLQNLPVVSEAGREVRKAIVSSGPGFSILSFDYNQVELRLLASLSGDPVMTETFRAGKDIHTTTASRVFDVDEEAVTKEMRSKAKGVNFGIAYGITPWGLATRLRISQKEAKQIIEAYFNEFSLVKEYLEKSVAESRERGFTRTLYGRVRYIEGIDSRNGTTRKVAERVAVNAPLQGLAADIIKQAMVRVHNYIQEQHLQSRLIMQVHDELVFDAADNELETLVPAVISIMESAEGLGVPLKVNATAGKNWLEQVKYALVPDVVDRHATQAANKKGQPKLP